jgi:hypothetical protein
MNARHIGALIKSTVLALVVAAGALLALLIACVMAVSLALPSNVTWDPVSLVQQKGLLGKVTLAAIALIPFLLFALVFRWTFRRSCRSGVRGAP